MIAGPIRSAALALAVTVLSVSFAHAETYSLERDVPPLRLGQRVLVDDGSCPTGQVKQIVGMKMTANGVAVARSCVPRTTRR